MNETQFQQKVLDLCAWLRLKAYHTYDSRRSAPGFPDLVIVGRNGVIFAELKSSTGKVAVSQQEWLSALSDAGQTAVVWRPEDFGQIQAALHALAER